MPDPASRPRLLVLDDEPLVCELVGDVARAAGFELRCASGTDEIDAAVACPCDAAVVDLHLGAVDVHDVLARLAGASPHCRVLLMTGSALASASEAAAWARSCGLDVVDEVHKPVPLPELRRLLAALAAPPGAIAS